MANGGSARRPVCFDLLRQPLVQAILAAGLAVRLALIARTPGHPYDMRALRVVSDRLLSDPLHLYGLNRADWSVPVWPYPPLHGLVALVADGLANLTGMSFAFFVRLPVVFADLGLALVVVAALRARGASQRTQLIALGLLVLGPVPIFDSAVHGQIDAAAFLPAVAALVVFTSDRPRREVEAGLLLGVAIAIKQPTAIVLLGLLVTIRQPRTALRLLTPAAAIPAVLTLPFLLPELRGATAALRYGGVPGFGGLSLLVHPALPQIRLVGAQFEPSALADFLITIGGVVTFGSVLVVAAILRRARVESAELTCVVLIATALAAMPASGPWYFYWIVPFLLLSNARDWAVAVQAVVAVPMLLLYRNLLAQGLPGNVRFRIDPALATYVYSPLMVATAAICAAFVVTRVWSLRASSLERPVA